MIIALNPPTEMQRVLMIVGTVALVACTANSTGPVTAGVASSWSGPISDAWEMARCRYRWCNLLRIR